ncbi:unnamed protein product, partial [Effrenium voratum]
MGDGDQRGTSRSCGASVQVLLLLAFCRAAQVLDRGQWQLHVLCLVVTLALCRASCRKQVLSVTAFLVVLYFWCQYEAAERRGQMLGDRLFSDILLMQMVLLSEGLGPPALLAWTGCTMPLFAARAQVFEVAILLLVPCAMSLAEKQPAAAADADREQVVHQCLKLVLRQLQVPLQLALSETAGDAVRLKARIQQMWSLLSGLDCRLDRDFRKAIKEIAASGDSDQVPPELAWWGDKKENEDPGSVEASTCESFWEEFPNDAQVLLEVELRDSMPVTEVKLLVPQTASFLHEYFVEDWEGFRNWLEPEVNRAVHGSQVQDCTSCQLRLPVLGRLNGVVQVDCTEADAPNPR